MSDTPAQDCAWVTIPTPFGREELGTWLDEPETLFRINSLLEISEWQPQGQQLIRLRGRNLSNEKSLDLILEYRPTDQGLLVSYRGGLKRSTAFVVEPAVIGGFQLRITDDYSGWPEAERQARLDEVDRSLPQWGRDLCRYFHAWKRWSRLAPWRWYMTRVWIRMKPPARRITRWVLWVTAAEMVAFLLVLGVLVMEQSG
jgi:hypothetical protein